MKPKMKSKPKRPTKADHDKMARALLFDAVKHASKSPKIKAHLSATLDELMKDYVGRKHEALLERNGFMSTSIACGLSDIITMLVLNGLKEYSLHLEELHDLNDYLLRYK